MGKHPERIVDDDEEEEEELDETEFIVEKILDRKVADGEVFYYLKWKGFNDTENTWVRIHLSLISLVNNFFSHTLGT